jgi:hypothetical protein
MGTTALFAELVVGGVLTLTWMFLLAVTALGPTPFRPLLDVPPPLAVGMFLIAAYTVGVVFDRVWDVLLEKTKLQKWFLGDSQANIDMTEMEQKRRRVYGKDAKTAVDYVSYQRTRMRVARASLFNFILITASGSLLLGVRYGGVGTAEFALTAVIGVVLIAASAIALFNLERRHERVLDIIYIEEAPSSTPSDHGAGSTIIARLPHPQGTHGVDGESSKGSKDGAGAEGRKSSDSKAVKQNTP